MSKRQILGAIGIWVIILPFLGFPSSWKTVLLVLTGMGICALAYSTRRGASRNTLNGDSDSASVSSANVGGQQSFVENK